MTAEMVRNAYQGIGGEYETLLKAFDRENEVFKKACRQECPPTPPQAFGKQKAIAH